jgi:hypothetical protein
MDRTAIEMRNRFVLALVFTLAILAWSSVGKIVFGDELATRFGLDRQTARQPASASLRRLASTR